MMTKIFFFYKIGHKATKKLYFENFEKTSTFGCMVRTLKKVMLKNSGYFRTLVSIKKSTALDF